MGKSSKVAKLGLIVVMAGMMAACGKEEAKSPETTTKTLAANPLVTLKMMTTQHPLWPYKADWPIYKYIKEKTNIDFKVTVPAGDYTTAVNLAISSGDMPDLLIMPSLTAANNNGNSGALLNYFENLDKMPNYKKFLEQHPEVKAATLSPDGKSYYLPHYGLEQWSRRSWLYRDDIFKKNNLTPPTDWDQMYTVSKKLKQLYPTSYPVAIFDNLTALTNIAPAFNTWYGSYVDYEKNEWRYGPTEDSFKSMLMTLNKFVKEGLIPPDFMAMKRDQFNDLMAQNKGFIASDYVGTMDELPVTLKKSPADFSLDFMAPPKGGANGKPFNAYGGLLSNGFAVAAKSKNKDAAIRYLDFLFSPEGIDMVTWGKEGETYTTESGKRKFKPDFANFGDIRTKTGIATYGSHLVVDMNAYAYMNSDKMNNALKKIQQGNEAKLQPRLAYTEAENEILTTTNAAITKYRDEQIAKFILGQKSFDEWPGYVAEIQRLGVDKLMEVNKAAYARNQKFLNGK
jgi:putative aldouronate transport system substrate-binding protein